MACCLVTGQPAKTGSQSRQASSRLGGNVRILCTLHNLVSSETLSRTNIRRQLEPRGCTRGITSRTYHARGRLNLVTFPVQAIPAADLSRIPDMSCVVLWGMAHGRSRIEKEIPRTAGKQVCAPTVQDQEAEQEPNKLQPTRASTTASAAYCALPGNFGGPPSEAVRRQNRDCRCICWLKVAS